MPKLIVEDSGSKRAFRLSKGRLTVGSSDEAKLTLAADGVEPQHAAITIRPDGASVDAQAEVRIDGQPALGEGLELRFGSKLAIGDALLELESDDAGARPAAAAGAAGAPSAKSGAGKASAGGAAKATGARPAAAKRSTTRASAAAGGGERPAGVQRRGAASRAREKQGLPGWVLPVGVIVLLGGAVVVYNAVSGGSSNPLGIMNEAERAIGDAGWETARGLLGKLDPTKLSAADQSRYRELEAQIAAEVSEGDARSRMAEGASSYGNLLSWASKWLKSEPYDVPNARYFLVQLEDARAAYPDWDSELWRSSGGIWADVEAVQAIEVKAKEVASLQSPPTAADVIFLHNLRASGGTSGKGKRDYRPAFAALEQALAASGGEAKNELQALSDSLVAERSEYARARLSMAAADLDEFKTTENESDLMRSAGKLVEVVLEVGDPQAREQATTVLLGMPRLDRIFLSYEVNKPELYEQLMADSRLRSVAQAGAPEADAPE